MKTMIRTIAFIGLMAGYILIGWESDKAYGGEGPQVKIGDVPEGYKLVKKDAECVEPDPCKKEKEEIKKLKAEIDKLKARNKLLEDEKELNKPEPEVKIKTIYKDKIIEKPVDRVVEKTVTVPAARAVSIGGMLAYSQDGIDTSSNKDDEYAEDAETYRAIVGGPYITIPVGERLEIGAFGLFGGVNQTIGAKVGLSL
jgi:hypothetical protein